MIERDATTRRIEGKYFFNELKDLIGDNRVQDSVAFGILEDIRALNNNPEFVP